MGGPLCQTEIFLGHLAGEPLALYLTICPDKCLDILPQSANGSVLASWQWGCLGQDGR